MINAQILIFLSYFIAFFSALLIVAIGDIFSERSGIVNIGLEAIMAFSVMIGLMTLKFLLPIFPGFLTVLLTVLSAMLSGMLFSLLIAVPSIKCGANQTLVGNATNMLSYAITIVLTKRMSEFSTSVINFNKNAFMFKIGSFMFSIFTIIGFFVLILGWFVLYYTKFGFRLRSCGENPVAAFNSGINVIKYRYIGVLISGLLAGIGGLAYIIPTGSYWDASNSVYGFGFLAISVVIFGFWRPYRVALAALFFSFFIAFSYCYEGIFLDLFGVELNKNLYVTNELFKLIPYLLCLIVLVFVSKKNVRPKSLGKPYIQIR
ncbi:MAG: ABC transporter permease [Bacilli bacterium]|nr:ABC transporter permease [Bacilli bacterium]